MERVDRRWIFGAILVVAGVLFLIQNLGFFNLSEAIWGILFTLGGLAFLTVFITNRVNWWALIPAMALLGIGGLILMGLFLPAFASLYGGAFFLGMLSLGFWLVFFLNNDYWWAIIPAGVLLTLAVVAGLDRFFGGIGTGGIFFLGLGLTFLLLAVLPTPQGRMRWPLIPGAILVLFGVILGAASSTLLRFLWPVVLIAAGLFLFFRRIPSQRDQ